MTKIKYAQLVVAVLFSVSLLVSCKSGKELVRGEAGMRLTGEAQLEAVIANTPVFESFSSRLRLTVPAKKSDYTVSGTFKMKRDELIQISLLVPIIRTEAARIEISPEHVLVIDRIHKRYIFAPVSALREIFHAEVDYPMLQSLFSNALFLPGKYNLARKDYHSFKAQPHGENEVELSRKSKELMYTFLISSQTNRLLESRVETHSEKYGLRWRYDDFVTVGETIFPSKMVLFVGEKELPKRSVMELSRLSVDKQVLTPTTVPDRYERIALSDFFKTLENL